MFSYELFWKVLEERSAALGYDDGLTGRITRDICYPFIVMAYVSCKGTDPRGRPWDDRKWGYRFDTHVVNKIVDRSVPKRAFEPVPTAVMELAVRSLLGERIPGLSVNAIEPDGKWEPVAADAVIEFVADYMLPDIRREIAELPLKHEPRERLVKVEGGMAYFERYDRSPVSRSKSRPG